MEKPNILLITVDCLRADHMSCYGYDRETTPVMNNIFRKGGYEIYRNHMTNGPTTPNSFPSIMCSRYRLEMNGLSVPNKWMTISEILKENGYRTVGMASANPWTSRYFGYHRGFSDFEDYIRDSPMDGLFKPRDWSRIERFIRNVYDIIDNKSMKMKREQDNIFQDDVVNKFIEIDKDEPWFMWIHYMNAHTPYITSDNPDVHMRFVNKMISMDRTIAKVFASKTIELYDDAIKEIDENIGLIIKDVDENTMVIITSDHGEAFNEHNFWEHHFDSMYEECLKIPLVIKYPEYIDIEYDNTNLPSSSVDIMPTISEVTNGYLPPVVRGISLLGDTKSDGRPIFHEGMDNLGIFDNQTKCRVMRGITYDGIRMVRNETSNTVKMFDLSNDSEEKYDISGNVEYKSIFNDILNILNEMISNEKKTSILEYGGNNENRYI